MHLSNEEKADIFEKYGTSRTDTGSPESQIARILLSTSKRTTRTMLPSVP